MPHKPSWDVEKIRAGLERFKEEHGRYPTATEMDAYDHLPTARTIERRFGGLVAFRRSIRLEAQEDMRTGLHSAERARKIAARAHDTEKIVRDFLVRRFGLQFVHREFFFTDDHRTRADFFVYDNADGFCVDVFYPASIRNLAGCLNIKMQKYAATRHALPYPVILLQMNDSIPQEKLNLLLKRKKKSLPEGQALMGWETFKQFCSIRKPLKLAGMKKESHH